MGGMEGGVVEQPTGVVWHLLQSIERALPTVWMPQLVHACLADDSGSVPAWHTTALTVVTLAALAQCRCVSALVYTYGLEQW